MSSARIRFSTNLITFFHPQYWGLPSEAGHEEWAVEFASRPRHYLSEMLSRSRDAGMEGIEFSPAPGTWDAALDAFGGVAGVRDALESAGLELSSAYAPGRQIIGEAMADDEALLRAERYMDRLGAFLAEFGATTIVSGNLPRSRFGNDSPDETATAADFSRPVARAVHERFAETLNHLGAVVRRHGVKIAIHTDAYSICSRPEDIATVMSLSDPDSIALCPDAGHITLDGGDPVRVLEENLARIPTMHWKDCAHPESGHVFRGDQKTRHSEMLKRFRVLGSGVVDWKAWAVVLRDAGWSGWATEEIDMSPDPVGELRQGLRFFERELAPILT